MSTFSVSTVTPFRLDLTAWVLRRRAKNNIDRWDGRTYSRILTLDDVPVELTAIKIDTLEPKLEVGLRSKQKLSAKQQNDAKQLVQKCSD